MADDLIKIVWDQDGIYEINFYTRFWVKYSTKIRRLINNDNLEKFNSLIRDKGFWKNPTKESDHFKFY